MIEMKKTQEAGETPEQITVSMIDQDLKDGVSKSEMAIKYGIKPWEVDEMFKHPFLKGRRPSKKKPLSFSFVDDVTTNKTRYVSVDAAEMEEEVDPNQVTLENAIDEAIESVEEVKDQMQETQEAIVEMLSPTEYETPEETLLKVAHEPEITGIPNGDTMSDTDDEEYVEVEEEDDNTFEL
tara:strand:+ start:228 stop:770 length:543 start_codon:yes stop_codon:yes gene_type:complete